MNISVKNRCDLVTFTGAWGFLLIKIKGLQKGQIRKQSYLEDKVLAIL